MSEKEADRVLETMLEELGGRARPPDLTGRIARELQRGSGAEPPVSVEPRRARWRWSAAFTAAAAGFLVGLAMMAWLRPDHPEVLVRVEVARGSVEFERAYERTTVLPGPAVELHVTPGDRIRSESGAALRLLPFGALVLERQTTVEIESMSWTKRDGVLVVGSLSFGAIAGGFSWSQFGGGDAHAEGGVARIDDAPNATVLEAEVGDLRRRLEELRAENEGLRSRVDRTAVVESQPVDSESAEPAIEPEQSQAFLVAGGCSEDILGALDWELIGSATKDMVPLFDELMAAVEKGESPDLKIVAELQRLNAGLVAQASALADVELGGAGINGRFTHPSIVGNQVLSTLAASGIDVTDEQRTKLTNLMDFYGKRDANLRADSASHAHKLETLVAEFDYKQEFFGEIESLLTPDQFAALTSPGGRDRVGMSVFGTNLVMAQFAKPSKVAGPDSMTDRWTTRFSQGLGLEGDASKRLNGVVREWVDELPKSFWQNKSDALERRGVMRGANIHEAARRQLDLQKRLLREFGATLSPEAREQFMSNQRILVPLVE